MDELRFSCDAMLGKLARWLRFAGFDTHFVPHIPDLTLAAISRAEGRWLLTRDRLLASVAGPRSLLVAGVEVASQVAEMRRRLPLSVDPERFFSRCSSCNGVLREAERSAVVERVPPFVAASAARFSACPDCGRIYWPGSHVERIRHRLDSLFGGDQPALGA